MKKMYVREEDLTTYEKETGFISYKRLVDRFINDMVLCNNIIAVDSSIFENIEVGKIEEDDEIYQYYIISIDKWSLETLKEKYNNDLIICYSELLDNYILMVNHWGTAWDYVGTDILHTQDFEEGLK